MFSKKTSFPNCAGFIVICDGHVLLVATHQGKWGFPKGKRTKGETLEECAYRELEEETGLKQNQILPIDMNNIHFDEINDKGHTTVRLYLARTATATMITPKIQDEDELAEVKWVNFEKALDILTIKNRKQILENAIHHLDLNI